MNSTITIPFREPPSEITREEILKQVTHLSASLRHPRISPDGLRLDFEVSAAEAETLRPHVTHLCQQIQRSLRRLERKVVFRSRAMADPVFRGAGCPLPGVWEAGKGQVMIEGASLAIFNFFADALAEIEREWKPRGLLTPTLIPARVLAKCDYFRSFPHTVTFACHLEENAEVLKNFRARHEHQKEGVDAQALSEMAPPCACLSPAVCYHVYHRLEGTVLPAEGAVYGVRGKCFRYESSNLQGLNRLWDFTMRELVFLGSSDGVLRERQNCVEVLGAFLDQIGLAAEIRTASDPFYIAPDAAAKTYFQLTAETKYEIAALLSAEERLAVGSFNYHTDFFGRAFDIHLEGAGKAHSVCVGMGLERLTAAFLAQHGGDPTHWPDFVISRLKDCQTPRPASDGSSPPPAALSGWRPCSGGHARQSSR